VKYRIAALIETRRRWSWLRLGSSLLLAGDQIDPHRWNPALARSAIHVEKPRGGKCDDESATRKLYVIDNAGQSRHRRPHDNAAMHSIHADRHPFTHASSPAADEHDERRV
jgi:hypothetical protein